MVVVKEKLIKLLYGRKCWVCGAELKDGEGTVCYCGVHRNNRKGNKVNIYIEMIKDNKNQTDMLENNCTNFPPKLICTYMVRTDKRCMAKFLAEATDSPLIILERAREAVYQAKEEMLRLRLQELKEEEEKLWEAK